MVVVVIIVVVVVVVVMVMAVVVANGRTFHRVVLFTFLLLIKSTVIHMHTSLSVSFEHNAPAHSPYIALTHPPICFSTFPGTKS